jgi:hypothetical protein
VPVHGADAPLVLVVIGGSSAALGAVVQTVGTALVDSWPVGRITSSTRPIVVD